jgi:hypothetical protein
MTDDCNSENPSVSELRMAGASQVLPLAAAQNGDWASAEQGTIDAQQRAGARRERARVCNRDGDT